jgi:hypothetical protein
VQDLVVHSLHVGIIEGRETSEHLEEQGAERPPVHGLAVAFVLEDLGGQVLGGAAEGLRAAFRPRAGDVALNILVYRCYIYNR